jgi:hypothetical protein
LTSTLVTWEAGGVTGGNSTFGTIDTNGNYTAPLNVPSNNIVTITAVSQSQTSVSGTASITILQPTKISAIVCLDQNSQASLTVASGESFACTAESSSESSVSAFWQVDTIPNGNSVVGTMTAQGNYTAPLIPPAGGTVTITGVSQADATQKMSLVVNVTFGDRVLQGPYAFSMSGTFTAAGFFVRAGSFTADGNGNLKGGIEDINPPGGSTTTVPFTGLYAVGPDGRGTMQFCEHTAVACTSGPGGATTASFRVVVLSTQQAQIIQFDAGATANGDMVSQNVSVFNAAGLSGTYTFDFSGISSGTTIESAVGEFVADGKGKITSGEIDINTGGAMSQLSIQNTSTYSVIADGRGIAKIITTSKTFVFSVYMISASAARFVEQDATPVLTGDAFKQQFGGPWGVSTLNGSMVFGTAGSGVGGRIADLVSFTADGTGIVTAGSGMVDQNSAGTISTASSLGGNYTFDASGNGRGTLSISGHSYVFYMIAESPAAAAVVQETTAGVVAHGSLIQPQGGPFTAASLQGSYALGLSGLTGNNEEDVVGQLSADGNGKITNTAPNLSTLDINNFGTLQAAQGNSGTYGPTVPANGRTTMSLTSATMPIVTRNFVLYFVSPTAIVALGTDSTDVAIGSLFKQF